MNSWPFDVEHAKSVASAWRVVVVDDEADCCLLLETCLRHFGVEVVRACHGGHGLQVIRAIRPTFILSDLSMPGMDGWELLDRLQGDSGLKTTPVVAITAHAMRGDERRVMAAGFTGYLAKPFSPVDLMVKLLAWFGAPDGVEIERVGSSVGSLPVAVAVN